MEGKDFLMAILIVVLVVVLYYMMNDSSCNVCSTEGFSNHSGRALGGNLESDVSSWGTGVINRKEAERAERVNASMMNGYEDYNQVIMDISLDKSIYDSHKSYVEQAVKLNLGPSNLSERSDDNDIIPWSYRRPDYRSVAPGSDARVTSSQYLDQMPAKRTLTI